MNPHCIDDSFDEKVRIPNGSGFLGGIHSYPSARIPTRRVLLLSPHPHFAGTMDNNVMRALSAGLSGAGCSVIRFDYRGVEDSTLDLPEGQSAYDWWEELERTQEYDPVIRDAKSALAFLAKSSGSVDPPSILIGYSFGAILAARIATDSEESLPCVCVAPPLNRYSFEFVQALRSPALFLLTDQDFLYGEEEIQRLRQWAEPSGRIELVEGSDHFFRGRESVLVPPVLAFLEGIAS